MAWTDDLSRIQFQATATHIQWRYIGTSTWNNLLAFSASLPVTGPLTNEQLRDTPVPMAPNVTRGGGVIDANTQRVTLAEDGPDITALESISGLAIPPHDSIDLSYTGVNLTGVIYKNAGTTVATVTLTYSGSNLTNITRILT
jgi:hypothetical protein